MNRKKVVQEIEKRLREKDKKKRNGIEEKRTDREEKLYFTLREERTKK